MADGTVWPGVNAPAKPRSNRFLRTGVLDGALLRLHARGMTQREIQAEIGGHASSLCERLALLRGRGEPLARSWSGRKAERDRARAAAGLPPMALGKRLD